MSNAHTDPYPYVDDNGVTRLPLFWDDDQDTWAVAFIDAEMTVAQTLSLVRLGLLRVVD